MWSSRQWNRGFVLGLSLVPLMGGCDSGSGEPSPRARHVLLLTVDTLRPDYLSFNGYDRPTTPFLDRLVTEGLYFDRAVTPIPRTTQALASALTGCYPHTTKVRSLVDPMSPKMVTIAQMAQQAGYRTIAIVSNHMLGPERELNRGFEVYDQAPDVRNARVTTEAAIRHLSTLTPTERIFVWVHYIDPHVPYYAPSPLVKQFAGDYEGRYATHFGQMPGGIGQQAYPQDLPKSTAVYHNPLPEEVNAHIRRLYAADIRYTDEGIARLVTWMREQLGDDWVILFTADHGESLGEHGFFYDHGDYVYQASLAVPFCITLPRAHPLRRVGRCRDWVSLVDVMPTLAELMNLPLPAALPYEVEGRSLVPYLRGKAPPSRPVFAECGRSFFPGEVRRRVRFNVAGRFRTVIQGDWKLIWTPRQTTERRFELYNLAHDPREIEDLYSPDHPRAAALEKLLKGWLRATDDQTRAPSERDLEFLKSLGYVE